MTSPERPRGRPQLRVTRVTRATAPPCSASTSGGPALRLTAHAGLELFPKLSHDGKWIEISAEHTRTRQVHAMPAWGGPPSLKTKETRKLTSFTEFDVLWPSLGDGKILFMIGGHLHALDLATEKTSRILITPGSDVATRVLAFRDVSGNAAGSTR